VKVPAQGQATFTAPAKAGTYALTCDFHKQMTGTLVVTT
jgi:plastocyanin